MKKNCSFFMAIILFSLFLNNTNIYAQNESGTRYLDQTAFSSAGFWYDCTNSMFQMQYPIIRSIPPLSTGMPYDIMMSYIYLDSLLRFSSNIQQDSTLQTWTTLNDTLVNSIKYLYKMVDYNPIIFNQYMGEVALHNTSITGGQYLATLYNLRNDAIYKLKSIVSAHTKNAFFSLLLADYVLKVHIISIDSMPDKRLLSIESNNSQRYNVYATVLDTIKGRVFVDENTYQYKIYTKNQNRISSISGPIISFQYVKMNYSQHQYYPNDPYSNVQNDQAFMDNNGGFMMQVGQDAVVFLRHTNQLFDFQYDYFDLDLESLCSNNALPIIGGNVRDINYIWSHNLYQSYQDWKQTANGLINQILNGSY